MINFGVGFYSFAVDLIRNIITFPVNLIGKFPDLNLNLTTEVLNIVKNIREGFISSTL